MAERGTKTLTTREIESAFEPDQLPLLYDNVLAKMMSDPDMAARLLHATRQIQRHFLQYQFKIKFLQELEKRTKLHPRVYELESALQAHGLDTYLEALVQDSQDFRTLQHCTPGDLAIVYGMPMGKAVRFLLDVHIRFKGLAEKEGAKMLRQANPASVAYHASFAAIQLMKAAAERAEERSDQLQTSAERHAAEEEAARKAERSRPWILSLNEISQKSMATLSAQRAYSWTRAVSSKIATVPTSNADSLLDSVLRSSHSESKTSSLTGVKGHVAPLHLPPLHVAPPTVRKAVIWPGGRTSDPDAPHLLQGSHAVDTVEPERSSLEGRRSVRHAVPVVAGRQPTLSNALRKSVRALGGISLRRSMARSLVHPVADSEGDGDDVPQRKTHLADLPDVDRHTRGRSILRPSPSSIRCEGRGSKGTIPSDALSLSFAQPEVVLMFDAPMPVPEIFSASGRPRLLTGSHLRPISGDDNSVPTNAVYEQR